jgi:lipopolysaccharide export system permease protein
LPETPEKKPAMKLPFTLSLYIGRQFLAGVGLIFFILSAIILLSDSIETLRRSYGKELPVGTVLQLVLLNYPHLAQNIMPFAVMLGGILTFSRLTSTSELVVARAAGISAWQFLMPAVIISFLLGIFIITIFNPLSATLLTRYEQIESKYLRNSNNMFSVSASGLWLREHTKSSNNIIHALHVESDTMALSDITIFTFDNNNKFIKRFDADTARIEGHNWVLRDVLLTSPGKPSEDITVYKLPTTIVISELQDSFASPDTISFWELPGFIHTLKAAGFSALRHLLHWHSLLVSPLYLCAMVFIAATFSLRPPRKGNTSFLMVSGILVGFVIYFVSYLVSAIGLSGSIPIALAAWAPVIISILIGMSLMLHLEDG